MKTVDFGSLRAMIELGEFIGKDLVTEMKNLFLGQTPEVLRQMKLAQQTENFVSLAEYGQVLKTRCSSLGVVRMNEICKALQVSARNANKEGCGLQIAALEHEFVQVRSALTQFLH